MSPIRAAGWAHGQRARSRTNTIRERSLFIRVCSISDENNARHTNLPTLINQISGAFQIQPFSIFIWLNKTASPVPTDFELIYSHNEPFLSHTGPPGRLLNGDAWVQIAPVQKGSGVCPTVRPGFDITFHLYQFYDGSVTKYISSSRLAFCSSYLANNQTL